MTTELEQEFFKVFGIKQEYQYYVRDMGRTYVGNKQMLIDNKHLFMDKERKRSRRLYVANVSKVYPKITDRKLLEMICILSAYNYIFEDLKADDIEQLKEEIIKLFFDYPLIAEEEKTNIQQLFKEKQ